MRAWHLLSKNMKSANGTEAAWRDGEERTWPGELAMCESGYHGCRELLDCLEYVAGPIICRVELGGKMVNEDNKSCAEKRRLLWHLPAEVSERIFHEFACWCAERALHRERKQGWEPDARSWAAVERTRRWLRGEATAAARDAAWDAAYAAARDASAARASR